MKYLVKKIVQLISQSIFKNQSDFRNNLTDLVKGLFLKKEFDIISGNIVLDNEIYFDTNKSESRGNLNFLDDQKISEGYFLDDNLFFDKIIDQNLSSIKAYLGNNFVTEKVLFFRNYKISQSLKTHDIYSNIWHQDSHDGFKLLKIFVLLDDVTLDDGPFVFLDRKTTVKNFTRLRERWSFENLKELKEYEDEIKFVGRKGDYIIINTALCMHRASIPSNFRDMAQITIKPRWRSV